MAESRTEEPVLMMIFPVYAKPYTLILEPLSFSKSILLVSNKMVMSRSWSSVISRSFGALLVPFRMIVPTSAVPVSGADIGANARRFNASRFRRHFFNFQIIGRHGKARECQFHLIRFLSNHPQQFAIEYQRPDAVAANGQ